MNKKEFALRCAVDIVIAEIRAIEGQFNVNKNTKEVIQLAQHFHNWLK